MDQQAHRPRAPRQSAMIARRANRPLAFQFSPSLLSRVLTQLITAQRGSKLLTGPVQPGSNSIGGQLTRERDLQVVQPTHFAHEEDVTVEGTQPIERLAQSGLQRLCRRSAGVVGQRDALASPATVAHVIEGQVPRDAKYPRPDAAFIGLWRAGARDAQEDFLGQLAGVLAADDAAEIPEDAIFVRRKEKVGIGHRATLSTKDTSGRRSSQGGLRTYFRSSSLRLKSASLSPTL